MFGYIVVNEPDLRIREFRLYREYYCGLCMELRDCYGQTGRLTLSYDTTFLALLLTSLYEPEDSVSSIKCIAHPFEKHSARRNEYTRYAADISILLSYYSCIDDWQDEHRWKKRLMAAVLKGKCRRAGALHEQKAAVITDKLAALHTIEQNDIQNNVPGDTAGKTSTVPDNEPDNAGDRRKDLQNNAQGDRQYSGNEYSPAALIDAASGSFGEIMAEIFDVSGGLWGPVLRRMGYYLGKFIYIVDAYDDLEKDAASGSFNPLLPLRGRPDFDEYVHSILTMMMAGCSSAFETLPIVENVEILRNILYSGVWSKFELRMQQRRKTAGETGHSQS